MSREAGFDFKPIVTPYVGSPIKEFDSLGKVLNERYEKNLEDWDELDYISKTIPVLDGDSTIKDSAIGEIKNIMKGAIDKGDFENSRPLVREAVKRFRNDSNLAKASQNYKKSKELMDYAEKQRLQGKTMIMFQDPSKFTTIDPTTGKARDLTSDMEEQLDYRKEMETIYDNVQPDGYSSGSSSPQERNGMMYQVGSKSGGAYITKEKIGQIAKQSLDRYISSTEAGRQRMKVLVQKGGYSEADARKVVLNELTSVGLERVFSRTESESSIQFDGGMTDRVFGKKGETLPPPSDPEMERDTIDTSEVDPTLSSLTTKLTPNPKGGGLSSSEKLGAAGGGNRGDFYTRNPKAAENRTQQNPYGDLDEKERKTLSNVLLAVGVKKESNGKFTYKGKEVTSVNALKLAKDYIDARVSTGVSASYKSFYDTEIAKSNSYAKNGNHSGRKYYDQKEKKFFNFIDLPKEVQAEINKGEFKVSGVYVEDNPFYDVAKRNKAITNNDGFINPERWVVGDKVFSVSAKLSETSKTDIDFRRTVSEVSRPNRNGVPRRISNGMQIISLGNGMYDIQNKNGEIETETPLTDKQIAKYIIQQKLNLED